MNKFPVTAPDGSHYLVKITEGKYPMDSPWAKVVVYSKRKRWFPRRVYYYKFERKYSRLKMDGLYDPSDPNYVLLASATIKKMYDDIDLDKYNVEEDKRRFIRRLEARETFEKWDGVIGE